MTRAETPGVDDPESPEDPRVRAILAAVGPLPDTDGDDKLSVLRRRAILAGFPGTDDGNAQRLVVLHGEGIRYCVEQKSWYTFDGLRWAAEGGSAVMERARGVARAITAEGTRLRSLKCDKAGKPVGEDGGLSRWGLESQSLRRLTAMVTLASSDPAVQVTVAEFDQHPDLVNFANGTMDLRVEQLRSHDSADLMTGLIDEEYDPHARCPIFDAALARCQPSEAKRLFVRDWHGHGLDGHVEEQKVIVHEGEGLNGKSTLIGAIMAALGPDYAAACPDSLLTPQGREQHPEALARLRGKRTVIASEWAEESYLDETRVKRMSGGDTLVARKMRENSWEFEFSGKISICCNTSPKIKGDNHAIWRRLLRVTWDVRISEDDPDFDPQLGRKLRTSEERRGILTWLVAGNLARRQARRLHIPEEIADTTVEYREGEDRLGLFLDARCVVGETKRVSLADLYSSYQAWSLAGGQKPLSRPKFVARLERRDNVSREVPDAHDKRVWIVGVGLST